MVVGCIGEKHWSAVVTCRQENIRIISVRRSRQVVKRVNVDFPEWMIRLLDKEARRPGVPRQCQGTEREPTLKYSEIPDSNHRSVFTVDRMKVRGMVVAVVHADQDAVSSYGRFFLDT